VENDVDMNDSDGEAARDGTSDSQLPSNLDGPGTNSGSGEFRLM
jgi:hypothetical protein